MKRPIDKFKDKSKEEIDKKESLLDPDNLEKSDKLAMFLAAIRVFMPYVILIFLPFLLIAWFMWFMF